jgi:uncharacterized protein (DUF1697 family)
MLCCCQSRRRSKFTSRLCYPASMTVHIALLRAVNVGGRKLAMADLKAMLDALGFAGARTLLQSGNALFHGSGKTVTALESLLEVETERRLKLRTNYFVRTSEEWQSIIANNPFPRQAKNDPSHLLVLPLKSEPAMADLSALEAAITGREVVRLKGRSLYACYPAGIGESKLTVALIERKLKTSCTGRNWNTVLKLQEAAASL